MREVIVEVGAGVPDDQLARVTNGEIIRCRNCMNCDYVKNYDFSGKRMCWKLMMGVDEDDFCSWAERKE